MKVLIDTNVVLDFLQAREPFFEDAVRLFEKVDSGEVEGAISATSITNIDYILKKVIGRAAANDAIAQLLVDLYICPVDRDILVQALGCNFTDFEDAVQYACAIEWGADAVVTRDKKGFAEAMIPILLPSELEV